MLSAMFVIAAKPPKLEFGMQIAETAQISRTRSSAYTCAKPPSTNNSARLNEPALPSAIDPKLHFAFSVWELGQRFS
jgi:hypothetical protein